MSASFKLRLYIGCILCVTAVFVVKSDRKSLQDLEDMSNTNQAENFPPHWSDAPSSVKEYPIVNETVQINPWNYVHRLGLNKIILNATSGLRDDFGEDNLGNVLWGLALQFGWQFSTGRLKSFPTTNDCEDKFCVSYNSWWASMNYYLSVVPFLGAVNAGLIKDYGYKINLARSKERPAQYCTGVRSCQTLVPDTMAKWTKFFEVLKNQSDLHGNGARQIPLDDLLKVMWDAHISSIHSVIDEFDTLLVNYSKTEEMFGKGWSNLVDYLAACRFNTNLTATHMFQKQFLPKRVLQNSDRPPFIGDMTKNENFAIFAIEILLSADLYTDGALLSLWERAMCSEESQDAANSLLYAVVDLRPFLAIEYLSTIIKEFIFRCSK